MPMMMPLLLQPGLTLRNNWDYKLWEVVRVDFDKLEMEVREVADVMRRLPLIFPSQKTVELERNGDLPASWR